MRTPAATSWLDDIIKEDIPIDIDENMQTTALAYSIDSFWWTVIIDVLKKGHPYL